jgi:omega-amidase
MKIGLLQYSPEWENKKNNQEKIISFLSKADNIDLLILPELSLTGFTMNSLKFGEDLNGESVTFFSELAKEYQFNLVGGIIENEENKRFNTLLQFDTKGILLTKYRKIHPFSFSDEDKYYQAGESKVISEIQGWKTGFSICYDLRFPELYRMYGKSGVELLINIANWPDTRIEHWRTLLKARAIENQCFVAGVNRVGDDPKLHYNGFTSLFDPMGKEILSCENDEKLLISRN